MKELKDYNIATKRLWIAHEAFRRLGFSSDDIYVVPHKSPHFNVLMKMVSCVLKTQGKEFVWSCGSYTEEKDQKAIISEWVEFATQLNSGKIPEKDLQELWKEWPVPGSISTLIQALSQKGFVFCNETFN